MFLDDELLEMCMKADVSTPEAIQQLNVDLCKKCEDYYKANINANQTPSQVKVILDRTFKLWDSFVRMARESDNSTVILLGDLFKEHSFKHQFMQNEEVKNVYNKL